MVIELSRTKSWRIGSIRPHPTLYHPQHHRTDQHFATRLALLRGAASTHKSRAKHSSARPALLPKILPSRLASLNP